MTKMMKNDANPEIRHARPLRWILLAGGVLALCVFLMRKSPPAAPLAPAPAAFGFAKESPAGRIELPLAAGAVGPMTAPARPGPPIPLAQEAAPPPRATRPSPWELPAVGLPPDPAWAFNAEQLAQYERLSRDFLSETADPSGGRTRWVQARAASDEDFRLLFGDTLFFIQQRRAVLYRDDAAAPSKFANSDSP